MESAGMGGSGGKLEVVVAVGVTVVDMAAVMMVEVLVVLVVLVLVRENVPQHRADVTQ
jgi:hypothetical protein